MKHIVSIEVRIAERKAELADLKPSAVSDLKAGLSERAVCTKYGISKGTIRRWKRELESS